jgi:ribosomal protein L17
MRHGDKVNNLGRKTAHRHALLMNLTKSLIEHKRIITTLAKAKALRVYAEPLITRSKVDSTNNRRVVFAYLQDKESIKELFGVNPEGFNIQKYKLVPPSDTAVFKINAGVILQNNVSVPVFEIEDPHPFSKVGKPLKVGDMYNAVTSGNWK